MTASTARPYPFNPPEREGLDPCFVKLREDEPVSRILLPHGGESWLVTRYADARFVLSDRRFSRAMAVGPGIPRLSVEPGGAEHIMMKDPPEHTRLRRLAASAFGPVPVRRARPRVAELADRLLTEMADHGPPCDLVAAFSGPLPLIAMCEVLGVPYEDRVRFRGWVRALVTAPERTAEELEEVIDEFSEYVGELIEQRRANPTDDMLGELVRTRDEEDLLTEEELLTFVGTMLIAGQEGAANQLSAIAYVLLTRPDLFDQLRERPDLVPTAIEELLRHATNGSSVSYARVCTEDVEVGGVRMARGDAVMVSLPSANRDPAVFTDPEHLDLTRSPNPHMAFSAGPHHCMGSPLARMELQEAVSALVRRFPGLRLAVPADDVPWRIGPLVRAPSALPVVW